VRQVLLEVADLRAAHAGAEVVHGVSLAVAPGEAVALLGANGAGKTTLLRAVAGLHRPAGGRVRFRGRDVTGQPAQALARAGLAFVPAERRLFPGMRVDEHLALGAYPRRPDAARLRRVLDLFPRLAERRAQPAGTLSGGEQQMLAVGRALVRAPALLVLDEPSTGLAPAVAADAYAALADLRREGTALLVAEQQVPLALGLVDRGVVLAGGRVRRTGTAAELSADADVRRALMGLT
jgi:branched-chain amino acid transport system ATP-binding protein